MGEFWQAWYALSNLKVSSRNYARPGKTVEVKNASAEFDHDVGRTAVVSSWCINKSSVPMQTHQYIDESNAKLSEAATCLRSGFWSSNDNVADAGISLSGKSQFTESLVIKSHSQMSGGSFSNNIVHTSQPKECLNKLVNEMDGDDDDDGILEVIPFKVLMKDCLLSCFLEL